MRFLIVLYMLTGTYQLLFAQTENRKAVVVAFYNLENFFDTIDNPMVNDDDFTPKGIKHYTSRIYFDKVGKLATVISRIGNIFSQKGPVLLGVAEIENDTVLTDLVQHPLLSQRNYRFIHFDSRDSRGIDVALIYQPAYFVPEKAEKILVELPENSKEAYFTRDILYVKGWLAGDPVHIYVNHWPSRRGGEERSSPARKAAAAVCKQHILSLQKKDPEARILVMGDLNDDPLSASVLEVLAARTSISNTRRGELYNPWAAYFEKGLGTLANRDTWGLFDQIMVSETFLHPNQPGFYFYKSHIFNEPFLAENSGRYRSYPMRTWDGNTYRGGYSDHFPTYIVLLKKIK